MRIAVLGNPGSWYVKDLERAARERGHQLTRVDFRRLVARIGVAQTPGTLSESRAVAGDLPHKHSAVLVYDPTHAQYVDLTEFDAVIVRTMPPGSLEQVVYRMDALARLEAAGVLVLNPPKSIECAVDKYLTTARLHAAGLPVPRTLVCENSESALDAFEALGGDVVVKPIFGSEGRGIVRVSDPDLALRTFRTLERIQSVLYLQRYVDHGGCDVRALVLDGRILGGMRRVCESDFRTNVSRNGRGEPHELSESEHELALRAADATGTRFAGVDLLYDRDGTCYVIEVNAVPGWRAFQKVTGQDVAAVMIAGLERRMNDECRNPIDE